MTRLHDVPKGKIDQYERTMAAAGLDGELIDKINRHPELARVMVGALKESVAKHDPDLFADPGEVAHLP